MRNGTPPMRPTPWGPRPADWEIKPWSEIAVRAGEPVNVDRDRRYKQVTVRVRHRGVVERQIDARRNHQILSQNQSIARPGQFIISKIDARNGACGFIPNDLDDAIVTNDFPLYELGTGVDHRFIDYTVAQEHFWYLCRLASEGTTNRVRLSPERFEELEFVLPPLPEQRKIAELLSSVDQAIERTEAVIERVQEVKRAVAQELLTRGMPGTHSRFRQTEIGELPDDWEVVRLGDVIDRVTYGTSAKCHVEPNGVPVLRIPNVASGEIDTTDLKYADINGSELSQLALRDGDLLVVRTNGNPNICGRFALVRELRGEWLFASYLLRLRPLRARLLPEFFELSLNSRAGRDQLKGSIRTSAGNYNLSATGLANARLALPGIEEQTAICSMLSSVRLLAERETAAMASLGWLKHELASALLTGQIRVGNLSCE